MIQNTGMATDLINTSQAYDPNSSFTELASKVIWVFPNATKITTKGYGVVGSVFAPNAVVETKGGSINGQPMLEDYTKEMVLRFITLNLTGQNGINQQLKRTFTN